MQENLIQNTNQQVKKRKVLRRIFIGLGIFTGSIFLLGILIPLLFENSIKRLFINELNKNLATKVVIEEDDINLRVLSSFPNASLVFENAAIRESIEGSQKNFVDAGKISLEFNIRDIIKKRYNIKKINIDDATINLTTDKNGNINYKFWKPSGGNSNAFSVNLQQVNLNNVNILYSDMKNNMNIDLLVHTGDLSGNFTSEKYTVKTSADVLSKQIRSGSHNYFVNRELNVTSKLDINNSADTYLFKDTNIKADKNKFSVEGSISNQDELYYDLAIKSEKSDIASLVMLLPNEYAKPFRDISSKGDIAINAIIKGAYSKNSNPLVKIDFTVNRSALYNKKFNDELQNVSLTGYYSNGEKKSAETSFVSIKNFTATYYNEPVKGSLEYSNFKDPFINLQANGNLPASVIIPAMDKNITDVSGYFEVNNLNIKGKLKDFSSAANIKNPPTGKIILHALAYTRNSDKISVTSGEVTLEDAQLLLKNFQLSYAGSLLQANLACTNWLQPLLVPGAENNSPVNISGEIRAEKIDLTRFFESANAENKDANIPSKPKNKIPALMNLSGNVKLYAAALICKKFQTQNVNASLQFSPSLIQIKNCTGNTMQGNFEVNSTLRQMPSGNYMLENIGIINNFDVTELFQQFNNFYQTTLTDKNIKGKASAFIENVTVSWDKDFNLLENSVYALVNIKVENGELLNYKPLQSLSKFVDVDELKDIRFSTLQNEIEIKNRIITIPAMEIRSSALNLYMGGTHTFDNVIDYQFRLSMADLLVKKYFGGKNNKADINTVNYETDAEGGINIYVSMTGTVDNPVMKYNKKDARQKMKESGIEQKTFLDIFKNEPADAYKKIKEESPGGRISKNNTEETPADTIEYINWDDK